MVCLERSMLQYFNSANSLSGALKPQSFFVHNLHDDINAVLLKYSLSDNVYITY